MEENSLETRQEVATKIRDRYPDRIPVIVEKAPNTNAPDILKKKYLVPQDLTMGKFMFEIRKHMPKLRSEDSIFLFVQKSILPPPYSLISAIYEKHKDVDGFLYITYSGENTFGLFELLEGDC